MGRRRFKRATAATIGFDMTQAFPWRNFFLYHPLLDATATQVASGALNAS
jgi:hypothetical protein